MKSKEQVVQIQKDMISQLPELVKLVGESEDDEESLQMITSFAAKMAMVTFILEDRKIPFQFVEEAVMQTMTEALDGIEIIPTDDSIASFIKNALNK